MILKELIEEKIKLNLEISKKIIEHNRKKLFY